MTEHHNPITLADVVNAQMRIARYLEPTLLEAAPELGTNIWLKLENTNPTHSFKIRGALNAVLSLDDRAKARGIVAVSSGNHAQGVAYAAQLAGTKARILMPKHTPQRKIDGVRQYGAEAVLFGDNYNETEIEARRIEREDGLPLISPYNNAAVIAGAGTIGLEIVRQLPTVERVVVCVGGGGLISGIATAIKTLRPHAHIIGVNAESAPDMYNLFYGADKPENWHTLAEALSGSVEANAITIPIVKQWVQDILLVTEEQIAAAMRWMVDVQGWMVEGGGVVGVAALLHGLIATQQDAPPTVVIVSGGNVDGDQLRRVLNAG